MLGGRLLFELSAGSQQSFDPGTAKVRLNWGSPSQPEVLMSDLIAAATVPLIRAEEFRKNAAKAGWELWDDPKLQGTQDKQNSASASSQ